MLGSGPDRKRLEVLAAKLGIGDRVSFTGKVSRDEVSRYFEVADAFLFTSVRDTSGGVNLEAMAHELPIICIAHQGVGDITDSSCSERIVPGPIPQTLHGLAEGIRRLAQDPARRLDMGAAAARRAREKFSWSEKFDRMISIYEEACSHHR
jgi:glycosyltransferase involved in cell wall biosynthesis